MPYGDQIESNATKKPLIIDERFVISLLSIQYSTTKFEFGIT